MRGWFVADGGYIHQRFIFYVYTSIMLTKSSGDRDKQNDTTFGRETRSFLQKCNDGRCIGGMYTDALAVLGSV